MIHVTILANLLRPPCGLLLLAAVMLACSAPLVDAPRPDPTVQALEAEVALLTARLNAVPPAAGGILSVPAIAESTQIPEPTLEVVEDAAASPELTRSFPTRAPRVLTAADAAPCTLGQIKGNRNSRIYHVPGGGSYVQTRANVQCFANEGEAQAAGYRRALN